MSLVRPRTGRVLRVCRSGLTSEGAGIFDLTADGERMFLNAVNYMVPEPSSLGLLAVGSLALAFRRRKA